MPRPSSSDFQLCPYVFISRTTVLVNAVSFISSKLQYTFLYHGANSLNHCGQNWNSNIVFRAWLKLNQTPECYSKRLSLNAINNMQIYIDNLSNTNYKIVVITRACESYRMYIVTHTGTSVGCFPAGTRTWRVPLDCITGIFSAYCCMVSTSGFPFSRLKDPKVVWN